MGETVIGLDSKVSTNPNDSTSGTHNDPSTQSPTTKRRGRPAGTTNRATSTEETELLGLADVEGPKQVAVEIPAPAETKKRGRPKKEDTPTPVIPKIDSTQIQLLLVTISGVVASRPGMEIWNLTPQESKQIAEPLANILSKNAAVAAMSNEHADAIALVVACFMVFLPKTLLYISTKPKKPKNGDNVNYESRKSTQSAHESRTPENDSRRNAGERTRSTKNANQNFGGQLYELIPTIGGI